MKTIEPCLVELPVGPCTYCGGNDKDAPCAYPSEGKPGCLRDARMQRDYVVDYEVKDEKGSKRR